MTLKKNLIIKRAQSTVEYIMLFVIVASLTLISITGVLPKLRGAGEKTFNKAVKEMGLKIEKEAVF